MKKIFSVIFVSVSLIIILSSCGTSIPEKTVVPEKAVVTTRFAEIGCAAYYSGEMLEIVYTDEKDATNLLSVKATDEKTLYSQNGIEFEKEGFHGTVGKIFEAIKLFSDDREKKSFVSKDGENELFSFENENHVTVSAIKRKDGYIITKISVKGESEDFSISFQI